MDLWSCPGPFSTAELAAACRVSQRLVQKAVAAGVLDARRFGRVVRIPAAAARAFAVSLGVEAPPGPPVLGEVRDIRDVRVVRDVRMVSPARRS